MNLTILGNSEWTSAVTLASICSLPPCTKTSERMLS